MKGMLTIVLFFFVIFRAEAQPCVPVQAPVLSEKTRSLYEIKLAEALQAYKKDSTDADAIIWYGRRTAYLGDYIKAIDLFSKGIALHPGDARFFRHRGHRYITIRCFDKAIADFKKAAKLVKGKPDEVEPDGIPNAKNIPTSTLQSNIWYHLGLAYFIKGEYKKAAGAYRQCLKVSKNNDMYVATANWYYITLRKLKKDKEAAALLQTVDDNMELIENKDYHEILLLYKHRATAEEVKKYLSAKQDLGQASFGFGVGMYWLNNGNKAEAEKVFRLVTAGNQWAAFGFIAAEAELSRESGVGSRESIVGSR